MEKNSYNPDVLNCLANLSNDEVFTPPTVATQMIDLLPQELFRSPETRFLDPFSKSGVFLREIVKRLDRGLQEVIPDRQQRIDHILHKQVFGIAITELTAHLSRRTLYCSKDANSRYSVSHFDSPEGNLLYTPLRHTWGSNDKCIYCGASRSVYDRDDAAEQYAYQFIHTDNPQKIFPNMKFDVIIGNPPYQLSDGGAQASAMPIYNHFVEQAKKLNPRHLIMIVPARWLNGGRGLDDFRARMMKDERIQILHDFFDSTDCFSGVEIKGGVCYFMWSREYHGMCNIFSHVNGNVFHSKRPLLENGAEVFIRSEEQVGIFHKVLSFCEESLANWLNAGRYFGFHTRVTWKDGMMGELQTADGKSTLPIRKESSELFPTKVYVHGGVCWINPNNIPRNSDRIVSYKVLIPRSGNPGFGNTIIGKPKISEPNSCSSNTYMVAIPPSKDLVIEESVNLLTYLNTKFVRLLVATKTSTQSTPPDAFQFVPLQDFSHPWTDEMLYKKYGLEQKEIDFIESMIRPME